MKAHIIIAIVLGFVNFAFSFVDFYIREYEFAALEMLVAIGCVMVVWWNLNLDNDHNIGK